MSKLIQLKKAQKLNDVAQLLKTSPSSLAYILYKLPPDKKYTKFNILKKSGELRRIDAPYISLKKIQHNLAELLYECYEEIMRDKLGSSPADAKKKKNRRRTDTAAHGFHKELSIASNAGRHTKKKIVLNLDIENFFPSINFGRVRGYFLKNKNFRLSPTVATILAQIACHENSLPQGSPCSPIISNLIAQILDARLIRFAKKHSLTYTRYADDLTFSSNQNKLPKKIVFRKGWFNPSAHIGKALLTEIHNCGFCVNERKTRIQRQPYRQMVTGLVVNKYVNTPKEYYKDARAMCHSLFTKGTFYLPTHTKLTTVKRKKSIFYNIFNIRKIFATSRCIKTDDIYIPPVPKKIKKLEGILNFIYDTKIYRNKFAQINGKDFFGKMQHVHKKDELKEARHTQYGDTNHIQGNNGIRSLYAKFLYYKNFYAPTKPLIVCEGKTDIIYIKCALNSLAKNFPVLITQTTKEKTFNISFFKRTPRAIDVMRLSEGAKMIEAIISNSWLLYKDFSSKEKRFPIILIVDNDDEGYGVYQKCSKFLSIPLLSKKDFGTEKFYPLYENLYLITLPRIGANKTEIEDLFQKETLEETINGKPFDRSNNPQPNTYGKADFAQKIVRAKRNEIDFSGFRELLDRMSQAIQDYEQRL